MSGGLPAMAEFKDIPLDISTDDFVQKLLRKEDIVIEDTENPTGPEPGNTKISGLKGEASRA